MKSKNLHTLAKNVRSHQLILAAANGDLAEVNTLLAGEYDPQFKDSDGDNALMCAIKKKRPTVVKALIQAGFNLELANSKGDTPIILAAKCDCLKTVKELLANKVNLEARNKKKRTALYSAIDYGHTSTVAALVQAGADFDVIIELNLSPFLLTINHNFPNCMEKIITFKPSKLNEKDKDGDTPLFAALHFKSFNAFARLIKLGANIEIPNAKGETLLMVAVKKDLKDFVTLLLQNKASMIAVNGPKLLELATNDEMCRLLQPFLHKTFRERLMRSKFQGEPPAELICPVDLELFDDPVTVSCGHTINRAPLTRLFYKPNKPEPLKTVNCPCCREPIQFHELKNKTSMFIKNKLQEFVNQQEQGQEKEQDHISRRRVRVPKERFFKEEIPSSPSVLQRLSISNCFTHLGKT